MKTETRNKTVYFLENTMYINVTNLCTNNCVFCLRNYSDSVGGVNLWIDKNDPSAEEIIEEIKLNSPQTRDEIVFCGYGEPLIRIETVKQVASFLKQAYPEIKTRVNSNGQANLIHKRNVVPEISGIIDRISISLNAHNADLYQELSRSKFEKTEVFEAVKSFISECVKYGIDTTATIVTGYGDYKIDVQKCRIIAESLGAKFKIREWLGTGYE